MVPAICHPEEGVLFPFVTFPLNSTALWTRENKEQKPLQKQILFLTGVCSSIANEAAKRSLDADNYN